MANVRYVSPVSFDAEEPQHLADEIRQEKKYLVPLGWAISVIPLAMTLIVPNGLAMYAAIFAAVIALVGIHIVNRVANLTSRYEQDLQTKVWFAKRRRERFAYIHDESPQWRGDMPETVHNWCRSACEGDVTIAHIFDPMIGFTALYLSFEQDGDLLLFRMRFM
jgi:hypothetical protein